MTFHKIILGDCLKVLPSLEKESVDCIITDPPFNLPSSYYASRDDRWRVSVYDFAIMDGYFNIFAKECGRVLKKDGRVFLFCDCVSYPIFYANFLGLFDYVRALIWFKGEKHFSLGVGQAFRYSYEMILHAFNKNAFFVKENRYDVITQKVVPNKERFHPAEKPIELIKHLIKSCTKEEDIILDPFLGAGSTMVACKLLNRSCIGIEINPEYVEIAKKRLDVEQTSLEDLLIRKCEG